MFTRPALHDVVQHFDHVLHHLSSAVVKEHILATAQRGGKSNVVSARHSLEGIGDALCSSPVNFRSHACDILLVPTRN
ncbi:hypothetical protein CK203_106109 [Vitis vinifera]|uniref:Uncharacterized protein n=1 Tax=Vitis vinifera TaxID=29760 RepID=A0A438FG19_VITVI|nr:hypothetical protein CK203_106109 [Vitis vinifera]